MVAEYLNDFNRPNIHWAYDIIKMASDATALCFVHESVDRYGTNTAFTLTRFGSDIGSGTVTKCSVNRAKPCRTEPCWDYLTEPGQHSSVRFYRECKRFRNCAN